ncbi:hypothetical protein KAH81_10035 [bacterium]|nr:hypothetical protein [bacterium]
MINKSEGQLLIKFNCICGNNIVLKVITDDGQTREKWCSIIDSNYLPYLGDRSQTYLMNEIDDVDSFFCDECGTEHDIGYIMDKAF